ncbi:MAG: hypothetical protein H7195_09710 [Chryseobacterium sp.]|nr:hypothetical protein [Chryseobacterium sp.]
MNSIVQQDYIGGLFGFTLFAVILHYAGKSFLKDKLKRKEEFEKFVAENESLTEMDYNYKKYLMNGSATRYKGITFTKWMVIIFALIQLFKLILNLS